MSEACCSEMTVKEAIETNQLELALILDKKREMRINEQYVDWDKASRKYESKIREQEIMIKALAAYVQTLETKLSAVSPYSISKTS